MACNQQNNQCLCCICKCLSRLTAQHSNDTQTILDSIGQIPTNDYTEDIQYIKNVVTKLSQYTEVNNSYWEQQFAFNEELKKCCEANTNLLNQIIVKLDEYCKCDKCKNFEDKEVVLEAPISTMSKSKKAK